MVAIVALVACNRAHDTTPEAVGDASTTSAELTPFRFERPAEIDAAVAAPPPPAASPAPAPEPTRGADRVSIVGSSDHDENLGLVAADGGAIAPPPAPAPAAPPEPAPPAPTFRPPSAADPVPRNQFGPPPGP